MNFSFSSSHIVLLMLMCCCSTDKNQDIVENIQAEEEMEQLQPGPARVTDVSITGEENGYSFSVTISSPDTGCNQYADWWEVIDLQGNLVYRRILAHSHVDEQPFTRSGGPVEITKDLEVYVRAHMNNSGYGGRVFKGSVQIGFTSESLSADFAKTLETMAPQPDGCVF
ncbi:hypothetical protein [Maribacter halichondriae]|uniref:hypothetical protein n=1 Tax=Maribacter halichondriae TaxID=2980554 RepID=UPI0023591659|nr:hypothetical protein [Maribacter sp. Hal144]